MLFEGRVLTLVKPSISVTFPLHFHSYECRKRSSSSSSPSPSSTVFDQPYSINYFQKNSCFINRLWRYIATCAYVPENNHTFNILSNDIVPFRHGIIRKWGYGPVHVTLAITHRALRKASSGRISCIVSGTLRSDRVNRHRITSLPERKLRHAPSVT